MTEVKIRVEGFENNLKQGFTSYKYKRPTLAYSSTNDKLSRSTKPQTNKTINQYRASMTTLQPEEQNFFEASDKLSRKIDGSVYLVKSE